MDRAWLVDYVRLMDASVKMSIRDANICQIEVFEPLSTSVSY